MKLKPLSYLGIIQTEHHSQTQFLTTDNIERQGKQVVIALLDMFTGCVCYRHDMQKGGRQIPRE